MGSMRYKAKPKKHRWPKRVIFVAAIGAALVIGVTVAVRQIYFANLKAVDTSSQAVKLITIESGSTVDTIAKQLQGAGLIRSAWAFRLYVSSKEVRGDLQAGTYSFSPSEGVPQIVAQLTHGKVATDLVTILPGQRLDQVREALINYGFSEAEVDQALSPKSHQGNPALVDKPPGANLEGYLYPESFQRSSTITAQMIVEQSLAEMDKRLTAELRAAFAAQGLNTYQGIIMASIVEKEAASQSDREQIAQVYLKRFKLEIKLDADPTAYYGARLDNAPLTVKHDSPYNTYLYRGLPPGPIGNVSESSLNAVAHPAASDWLYFVSGDDGVTHFAKTLAEQEANTAQYCKKVCRGR